MFDRYTELTEAMHNRRGSHLMLIRKASDVRLDNVKITGGLCRCRVVIEECPGINQDCNL